MVNVVYWRPPGAVLHSSRELGELSQCFKHDDSTVKIILVLLLLLLSFLISVYCFIFLVLILHIGMKTLSRVPKVFTASEIIRDVHAVIVTRINSVDRRHVCDTIRQLSECAQKS